MAKNCSECGKDLTFRDSFVFKANPVCKDCLKKLAAQGVTVVASQSEVPASSSATMDIKRLTQVLLGLGGLVILVAFMWWRYFYGQLTEEMGRNVEDALGCLYSSGGPCSFVSGLAQLAGVTPYNPVVFWIGAVLLVGGLILRLSLREENTPSK